MEIVQKIEKGVNFPIKWNSFNDKVAENVHSMKMRHEHAASRQRQWTINKSSAD